MYNKFIRKHLVIMHPKGLDEIIPVEDAMEDQEI